jgi:hypothetical protein
MGRSDRKLFDHHHILPRRVKGAGYLDFLRNVWNNLFEDVPLAIGRDMW